MARLRSEEAKRVAAPGCRLPARLPAGEVLTDIKSNKWLLGDPVGWGGFGDIYLGSNNISKPVDQSAKYVIKIEPHDNGPLFVEMHFYIRAAQKHMVNSWCKSRGLRRIGVPTYEGSGSHTYKGQRYRFLVIPRYGTDIGKLFLSRKRQFSEKVVNNLVVQMLSALEYIHSKGYAHADIKGCNIILEKNVQGLDIEKSQAFLVDYGLAYRYRTSDGTHKPFVHDERRAHEGTLEYTSRDAHHGTHSRRGDLETLGYNIIQWLGGKLPWEDEEGRVSPSTNPEEIQSQKEEVFTDVMSFILQCFENKKAPASIMSYMKYVASLEFESKPDYLFLRSLFKGSINAERNIAKYFDRKVSNENLCNVRIPRRENLRVRKPCKPVNAEVRITRKTAFTTDSEPFKWEEVLATHPEKVAKVILQPLEAPLTPPPSPPPAPSYPTYAMLNVMYKMKERETGNKYRTAKFLNDFQAKWIHPPIESSNQLKRKYEKSKMDLCEEESNRKRRKSSKKQSTSSDNNHVERHSCRKLRRRLHD